jgi:hypothetical protein
MGTRADFYVGRGEQAEWLGSIGWDGYPSGIDSAVLNAADQATYRAAVAAFFTTRDDVTLPEQGWPWPWTDSSITDYAYAFDEGGVYYSYFGHDWHRQADGPKPDDWPYDDSAVFPDMSERKNIRWDTGSGLIVLEAD